MIFPDETKEMHIHAHVTGTLCYIGNTESTPDL